MESDATPEASQRRHPALAAGLRGASLCLVGLTVLYRPMVSGLGPAAASTALFGLLLLGALLLWISSELAAGRLRLRFGRSGLALTAFLAATALSSARAEDWFAALQWWLLIGTYGLTAFLVLQLATAEPEGRFLLSCLLATAVALAAYALWHYALYMPALRKWLELEPELVRAAAGVPADMAEDLRARVAADRAYGSFLTPNQLAGFLAIAAFPLAGLAAARWRRWRTATGPARRPLGAAALTAAALLPLVLALALTRSKGGWTAFLCGMVVFVRWDARKLLGTAAVLAVLVVGAHR
ncbi:MAG: hypothetical protein ACYS8K_09970, partial [Planctomycetota bacterium]